MRATFVARLRILSAAMLLAALLLVSRLYLVQVVRGDDFSDRADRQYVRPQEGVFDRGTIFFEDKDGRRLQAATIQSGFSLTINPTLIEEPQMVYDALTRVVPLDRDDFFARAQKIDDPYEVVAHQLSREQADNITALGLPGVNLYKEQWRYYPGETLAAQTIGFVGFDGEERTGRYGLERYYEDVLERAVDSTYINFFAEVFSSVGDIVADSTRGDGDIITTIEPSVQAALEGQLARVTGDWSSRSSGGIIINPKTGAVYAMGVFPTFDVNHFEEVEDTGTFGNPLVENIFEMGSIIKPLTMAAGIDANAVGPNTTYEDRGFLVLDNGNARISNYDGEGRGVVDMRRVLGESLNTGVAFVVRQMGNKTFAKYMEKFALDEETGIDLPGEVRGQLQNLESPRDVEYATASFGQGVAFTPIATVRALAALGNGGYLITPHIVKQIEHEIGPAKKIFYDPGDQVITPQTSEEITRMLVYVVDNYLLGGTVKLDRYTVAAKTGTAQIADKINGGYYDDRYFHSFFGYFPAYDPEFLIFLYTDQPVGVRYASQTLTHPFVDLTKFLISYYEVPPDR